MPTRAARMLGIDAELIVDGGAYAMWPNGPFLETGMAARNLPGPYTIRNYRVKTYTVATNKSPIGPYRGVGRPGACFAIERTIDEVARAVGRDPLEVRMENMVTSAQMPYTTIANLKFDNGDYPAAVRLCAEAIDLPAIRARQQQGEPDGRLIGVGFACFSEQTGHGCGEWVSRGSPFIPGYESCTAQLMPDGTLVLMVGIQSHGQGLETTLAQIAHAGTRHRSRQDLGAPRRHRALAIRLRHLRLAQHGHVRRRGRARQPDAARQDPEDRRASAAMRSRRRALRRRQDRRPQRLGRHRRDRPRRASAHGRAAAGGRAAARPSPRPISPAIDTGVYSYATHAAVVAVDPETGLIELLDFAVAEDCGTMVNPMIVEGQMRGGVVQGIGTALYEEIPYDEQGQPLAGTLADYLVPGAAEMPAIKIVHLHTPTPYTEYGIKGMGEGGAIAPAGGDRQCRARRAGVPGRRSQRDAADAAPRARRDPAGTGEDTQSNERAGCECWCGSLVAAATTSVCSPPALAGEGTQEPVGRLLRRQPKSAEVFPTPGNSPAGRPGRRSAPLLPPPADPAAP